MFRSFVSLFVLASVPATVAAQFGYVSGTGFSSSSAYVGASLNPISGFHDQDDDIGVTDSSAVAAWDEGLAWADSSLSSGGIIDYCEATAGADNTDSVFGEQHATWSNSLQSGTWNTGGQPVTYVFNVNVSVSNQTINGGSGWSEDGFLSGEANAGPYTLEWVLVSGNVVWTLSENGSLINFGSKALYPSSGTGTEWVTSLSESVTDPQPSASEAISATSDAHAGMFDDDFILRAGEAQTAVIVLD